MIETIHTDDTMFNGNADAYFNNSRTALEAIERVLSGLGNPKVQSIMDFGCGYGRVLRAIRDQWPNADIACCDLIKPAVDFCAETFNTTPIYGDEELKKTGYEGQFDLIWVGSVFTHLGKDSWRSMLVYLTSLLSGDGALVFTTHGRTSLWVFEKHSLKKSHITEEEFFAAKKSVGMDGFAFIPYSEGMINHIRQKSKAHVSEGLYGVSFSTPDWAIQQILSTPSLSVQGVYEGGWGRNHDVICATKPSDHRIV